MPVLVSKRSRPPKAPKRESETTAFVKAEEKPTATAKAEKGDEATSSQATAQPVEPEQEMSATPASHTGETQEESRGTKASPTEDADTLVEAPDFGLHGKAATEHFTKVEEGHAADAPTNFEEEPEEELTYNLDQEETPFPHTFEAGTNQVEVVLPDGRRERVIGTGLRSLQSYVDQFQQGLPLGTELVVDVDDQPAMDYDLLQLPPHGSPVGSQVLPCNLSSFWFECLGLKEGP